MLGERSRSELVSPVNEAWAPAGFGCQALKVVRSHKGRVTPFSCASSLVQQRPWADGEGLGRSLVDPTALSRHVATWL